MQLPILKPEVKGQVRISLDGGATFTEYQDNAILRTLITETSAGYITLPKTIRVGKSNVANVSGQIKLNDPYPTAVYSSASTKSGATNNNGTITLTDTYTFTFAKGAIVGVLGELGLSAETGRTEIITRFTLSNPPTIKASDQLVITYVLNGKLYVSPTSNGVSNILINGVSTLVSCKLEAVNLALWDITHMINHLFRFRAIRFNTTVPSNKTVLVSHNFATYPTYSFWTDGTWHFGKATMDLKTMNTATGIAFIQFGDTSLNKPIYHMIFTPIIPKTTSHFLEITLRADFGGIPEL